MKIIDFEIDTIVGKSIIASLEGVGVEQLRLFKSFLLATKPKLDPLIVCKGTTAPFVEMIDGKVTDYAIDFLVSLIDKLIFELEN